MRQRLRAAITPHRAILDRGWVGRETYGATMSKSGNHISLSVHRNTVENRRKRNMAKDVQKSVEALIRERDIRAYAFVGIGADGAAYALWDTGAILPQWAFPDTIGRALHNDMQNTELQEDWRPSLTPFGSR